MNCSVPIRCSGAFGLIPLARKCCESWSGISASVSFASRAGFDRNWLNGTNCTLYQQRTHISAYAYEDTSQNTSDTTTYMSRAAVRLRES